MYAFAVSFNSHRCPEGRTPVEEAREHRQSGERLAHLQDSKDILDKWANSAQGPPSHHHTQGLDQGLGGVWG